MKTFWKDYWDLCKANGNFYKKHWFGVIVIYVISWAATIGYLQKDEIKEQLESKFQKDEESQ